MWPTRLLYIFLTCIGAGLACDKDACNVGTSVGVGVSGAASAIGGLFCGLTFGIGCAVTAIAGAIGGAVHGTLKETCSYCDGSEGGFSAEQFRNLTVQALVSEYRIRKEVLGSEQRLRQTVVDSESRIRNEVLDSEQRLGEKVTQLHSETQDLISRRSQMVLDSLKEVDENITKLAHQMDNAKLELAKAIDLGSLQTSYHEDLEHYDLFERKFRYLERDASGLIVNNEDVETFKRVVNDHFRGAEHTLFNLHSMMVGNSRLSQNSIFETDSSFCKFKDYFLYVMMNLFGLDAIAKAMDGKELDAVLTQTFTRKVINVHQKHIEICGCPSKQVPKQMKNLQTLVSQTSPNTSVGEFYASMIQDDYLSKLDLKKLDRLYTVKPFDLSPEVILTIKSNPMEAIEIVHNLATRNSLHILPLLENTTVCTAEKATIVLSSVAGAAEDQGGRLGEFEEIGDFNERPFYKQRDTEGETDLYLFSEGGEWRVSNELGGSRFLKNNQNTSLPMTNNWLYYDGEKWINNDTSLNLEYASIYPCQLVRVAGKGDALEKMGSILGDYRPEAGRWSAGRPVYKMVGGESERFLFVHEGYSNWQISSSTTNRGAWIVSGRATSSPSNEAGPSDQFGFTSWRYADGGELKEGEIDVTCIEG